ncbi:hypothetical protein JB92DRAFT_986038 [Gautieria morchelliformis]|nr:hypothetical protein JB92DRAFT_986038 [Gautieria morchelliformis]
MSTLFCCVVVSYCCHVASSRAMLVGLPPSISQDRPHVPPPRVACNACIMRCECWCGCVCGTLVRFKDGPGEVVHSVLGISWSPDGFYLANGHRSGAVRCMDWRVNKSFDLKAAQGKSAHKKAVKS